MIHVNEESVTSGSVAVNSDEKPLCPLPKEATLESLEDEISDKVSLKLPDEIFLVEYLQFLSFYSTLLK